jgi:dihydrofolate reductase
MRKLIFGINVTIDGCCDHTKGRGYDDVHEYFTNLMHEVDLFVYGRKTYELMVPYWPDVAKNHSAPNAIVNEFAEVFASKNIVVFSKSLTSVDHDKTTIIRGNLRDEMLKLKQAPGKDILAGGVNLPTQLVELGLVDEFRIIVQPILAGEGRRLFDEVN